MASDEHYKDFKVSLQYGQVVTVQVSPELLEYYNSTDPDAKSLAQTLIVQAAMEKPRNKQSEEVRGHDYPESSDELPEIPSTDTASVSGVSSPTPTSPTGWPEKAENCLLEYFGELGKLPVKNKWLKSQTK